MRAGKLVDAQCRRTNVAARGGASELTARRSAAARSANHELTSCLGHRDLSPSNTRQMRPERAPAELYESCGITFELSRPRRQVL
jgi:hypothetical protein